jgi:hypothetical protein
MNEFPEDDQDLDMEADESTTNQPMKVFTPREKLMRSLEASYPKVYEQAVTEKVWDKISSTANPAGHLEVFAVKLLGVPAGQRRETVKALKRYLISGHMTLLEAAEHSCLADVLKKHQGRQARLNSVEVSA